MSRFSIKDIETITGIKAHTLRIWEQRYNFLKPKRTDTNIRYYDDNDLRFILNISILNNYGLKISEIARMSMEKMQEMVLVISEKDSPYSSQIKALVSTMFSLDENSFNHVLSTNILRLGLEATMVHVVFPFLHQIGVLWLTGAIHPAHEHFISNLIRQKLYVAIDAQTGKATAKSLNFLLFLPEREPHEIGLLFANYVIRSRGHHVVYLGQNLPFEDLQHVFDFYRPEYIFSAVTSAFSENEMQDFVNNIAATWPQATILLTGHQIVYASGLVLPTNIRIIKDIPQMIGFVDQLKDIAAAGH